MKFCGSPLCGGTVPANYQKETLMAITLGTFTRLGTAPW